MNLIDKLKNNLARYDHLSKEERKLMYNAGKANLLLLDLDGQWKRPHYLPLDEAIYRIHPDYKPLTPQPEVRMLDFNGKLEIKFTIKDTILSMQIFSMDERFRCTDSDSPINYTAKNSVDVYSNYYPSLYPNSYGDEIYLRGVNKDRDSIIYYRKFLTVDELNDYLSRVTIALEEWSINWEGWKDKDEYYVADVYIDDDDYCYKDEDGDEVWITSLEHNPKYAGMQFEGQADTSIWYMQPYAFINSLGIIFNSSNVVNNQSTGARKVAIPNKIRFSK